MRKADRERVSREKRDKIAGAPAATAEPGKTAVPAMKEPAVKRALLSGAKREKVAGASGVIGQAAPAATLAATPKASARQEFSQLPSVVAWLLPRQVSLLYLLPANIWSWHSLRDNNTQMLTALPFWPSRLSKRI